ncbi:hypothetical protein Q3G72_017501 [Acer saccharum]|nr:hypothetical protein Q3G72_017501 [Acer saccharum]
MKTVALPFSGCGYSFSSSSSSSTSSLFKILIVMAKNNKSQSSSSKFRKRKSSLPLATAGRKSRGRTFLKIRSYIVILPQPFTSNTFSSTHQGLDNAVQQSSKSNFIKAVMI